MRTLTALLMAALVLAAAPLAAAQDNTTSVDAEIEGDAGVTPDSILYGIDVALDKIRISLARDPEKRAERAMEVAEERLQEVRAMLEENREEQAERARERHAEALAKAEESVEELALDDEDANASVTAAAQLRLKAQLHQERIAEVHERILERQRERMNQTQIAHLEEVFAQIQERAGEMDVKTELKREQIRTRLKAQLNISDDEIQELEERIDSSIGLALLMEQRAERLRERFENREELLDDRAERAREELREQYKLQLERLEQEIEHREESQKRETEREIEIEIADGYAMVHVETGDSEQRFRINETEPSAIKRQVAERLNMTYEEVVSLARFERAEAETEIEVEVRNGTAYVTVESAGLEKEFRLQTGDRGEITRQVAAKIGMTPSEVDAIMEFEIDHVDDDSDDDGLETEIEVDAEDVRVRTGITSRT